MIADRGLTLGVDARAVGDDLGERRRGRRRATPNRARSVRRSPPGGPRRRRPADRPRSSRRPAAPDQLRAGDLDRLRLRTGRPRRTPARRRRRRRPHRAARPARRTPSEIRSYSVLSPPPAGQRSVDEPHRGAPVRCEQPAPSTALSASSSRSFVAKAAPPIATTSPRRRRAPRRTRSRGSPRQEAWPSGVVAQRPAVVDLVDAIERRDRAEPAIDGAASSASRQERHRRDERWTGSVTTSVPPS